MGSNPEAAWSNGKTPDSKSGNGGSTPLAASIDAAVAKLVTAPDLDSGGPPRPCGFESRLQHQIFSWVYTRILARLTRKWKHVFREICRGIGSILCRRLQRGASVQLRITYWYAISQPLSERISDRDHEATSIIKASGVPPEIELIEIQVHVLTADMVKRAHDAAL